MTLKEADEVAQKLLPVEYNGITYKRIRQSGWNYDEFGRRSSAFVTLEDKCKNSVTVADPAYVTVKEESA